MPGVETRHFRIVGENGPPSLELQETLEILQANLMLDLSHFAPWAKSERVVVYLAANPSSFKIPVSKTTRERSIVLSAENPDEEAAGKLGSLYFESFFPNDKPPPLWLSAGMHMLFWAERGATPPSWLAHTQKAIAKDTAPAVASLLGTKAVPAFTRAKGRLWHGRAYSLVRFLLRGKRSEFFEFW